MAEQPISPCVKSPRDSTLTDDVVAAAAPSDSSVAANPRSGTQHHILSCTNCRKRKVKCTKTSPCAACERSNITCIFPNRARLPRGRSIPGGAKTTNVELLRRVTKLEELLEKANQAEKGPNDIKIVGNSGFAKTTPKGFANGVGTGGEAVGGREDVAPALPALSPTNSEDALNKYIGSNFWKNLSHEVEGLRKTLAEESEEEEDYPTPLDTESSGSPVTNTRSARILGLDSPNASLRSLHPPPAQILMLCTLYVENFDPVFKILHIPTLQKSIIDASSDIENVQGAQGGKSMEALLFAMYHAGVTTLSPEKCMNYFQIEKEALLNRYRYGVEMAFANADLFASADMVTLQALVIFLICVRCHDDSQFAWTLTAVAIRLAHSLGLHRESPDSSLSPFTQEMRRRLWWQICVLDIHAAEDRGSDSMINEASFTTKKPLNINDDDLDPESSHVLSARTGFTSMTFCAVGHEVWSFNRRCKIITDNVTIGANSLPVTAEDKISMMSKFEQQIKEQYLVHCNLSNPIAWVTVMITRLILSRLWLAIYHPLQQEQRLKLHPGVTREQVLSVTVEIMEGARLLELEPATAQWRWFFNSWVQWHALAVALAELCVQNQGPLVQRAWAIIDIVFEPWAAHIADSKRGMLWRPIQKLNAKARMNRRRGDSFTNNRSLDNITNTNKFSSPIATPQQQQQKPLYSNHQPQSNPNHAQQIYLEPEDVRNMTLRRASPAPQLTLPQTINTNNNLIPDPYSFDINNPGGGATEESMGMINWAEWDAFLQDSEMEKPLGANLAHQDAKTPGMSWF